MVKEIPFKDKSTYDKWYSNYTKKPEVILRRHNYNARPEIKLRSKLLFNQRYKNNKVSHEKKVLSVKKYYTSPKGKNKHRQTAQISRNNLKLKIYNHYSNYDIKCNCCGEKEIMFLSLDHINNDGHKHRKEINNNLHTWIKNNNFPLGFQILCMNCNHGKMRNKDRICPHQLQKANNFLSIKKEII